MILRMGQEKITALGIGQPDQDARVSSPLLSGGQQQLVEGLKVYSKHIDLQDEVCRRNKAEQPNVYCAVGAPSSVSLSVFLFADTWLDWL